MAKFFVAIFESITIGNLPNSEILFTRSNSHKTISSNVRCQNQYKKYFWHRIVLGVVIETNFVGRCFE